jgi:5-formyltetrahydrofolate cyclo-ligase
VADQKKILRLIFSESRCALDASRVEALSDAVQSRLLAEPGYRRCRAVVLYSSKDNEVRTDLILSDALKSGRQVCFPRLASENRELELVTIDHPSELTAGAFGILEPSGSRTIEPSGLARALICVPGVVFSVAGERIGRGRGHYDRLLSKLGPTALKAGLAYSFQLLDSVPQGAGDERLDLIVTETATHAAAAANRRLAAG